MRVFIAIEIPEAIKKEMSRFQNKMMNTVNKIKWVNHDSMHVTLRFLGEIKEEKLNEVFESVEKITIERNPFSIKIKGAGAFPDKGNPRVIWMGIKEGFVELAQMAKDLEKKLSEQDFPQEGKKWMPHITLGRVKQLKDKEIIKKLITEEKNRLGGKAKVEEVTVMRSHLTPRGAIYSSLQRFSLRGE